jgi:GNAT superfamily N-acetyltransferase
LAQHWKQVIELIELAFGETLDAEGRRALQSMRPPHLLGRIIGILDRLAMPGEGMMPGYVWRAGGRVVGTSSVRRVQFTNNGWLISNVAVHPTWQGQGIGRALVESSIDYAEKWGANWIVLQVREDNSVARHLYESLDFKIIGKVVRLRVVPTSVPASTSSVPSTRLRPARWSDGKALSRLARRLTPHDVLWPDSFNRDLYKTGALDRFATWIKGISRRWWIYDLQNKQRSHGSQFSAAIGVEVDSRTALHRLRLVIPPETQNENLASKLISFGLAQLPESDPLPIEIEHPESDKATQSALTAAGFEPVYALIHMRLNL